jgi:hypothetical protein
MVDRSRTPLQSTMGEFDRKADFAVVRHEPCEPLTQVGSAAMDASEDQHAAVNRRSA